MKKIAVLADSDSAMFLSQLSKQALVDFCFDLALQVYGKEDDFRREAAAILRSMAEPVIAARGDRLPKATK